VLTAGGAVQRIAGFAAAVLLIALGRLLIAGVNQMDAGYPITAVLGDAGVGLSEGHDVKMRGVLVGEVMQVDFQDGRAVAQLEIDENQVVPDEVDVIVTAKTLLGPKQVELHPRRALEPPFLQAGDTIAAPDGHSPTELQDVVHEFEAVFGAIPADDLAALVDAMGSFNLDDAETFRRNLDQGAELTDFGARTADAQLARMTELADVMESLGGVTQDITRLSRSLPTWTSLLPDRQADIRAGLDALSSFSIGLAEMLEVQEPSIRELMVLGDRVGGVIEPRVHEIGEMVFGIFRYMRVFGEHGGSLNDGTEHTWFRSHLFAEGEAEEFCQQLPPELAAALPGCVEGG
jgi:virulence factor Mce-like protein